MKICILMPHSPEDANSGARVRTLTLKKELESLGHEVVIMLPSWTLPLGTNKRGNNNEFFIGRRRSNFHWFFWRIGLSSRRILDPYAIHHDAAFRNSISRALLETGPWDVVDIQHSYLPVPFGVATVLTVHNVLANANLNRHLGALGLASSSRFEGRNAKAAGRVVTFSQLESSRFISAHPQESEKIRTVAIGHPELPMSLHRVESGQRTILLVGSMDYAPNLEAARFLVSHWARIQSSTVFEVLEIVGRDAEKLTIESLPSGVRIASNVHSLVPFYERASVTVMPISQGGGVRMKALEAMAFEVPIIATALAVEGIGLTPDVSFLEFETVEELVVQLQRVEDTALSRRISAAAKTLWEQKSSPGSMARSMLGVYAEATLENHDV